MRPAFSSLLLCILLVDYEQTKLICGTQYIGQYIRIETVAAYGTLYEFQKGSIDPSSEVCVFLAFIFIPFFPGNLSLKFKPLTLRLWHCTYWTEFSYGLGRNSMKLEQPSYGLTSLDSQCISSHTNLSVDPFRIPPILFGELLLAPTASSFIVNAQFLNMQGVFFNISTQLVWKFLLLMWVA